MMKRVVLSCMLMAVLESVACAAEDIDLNGYTCAQFLADSNDVANSEKLLKSLMMISWGTGFAAAFQQNAPRADAKALRLIAATLGVACQQRPDQTAVQAIVHSVDDFTILNKPSSRSQPPIREQGPYSSKRNRAMRR